MKLHRRTFLKSFATAIAFVSVLTLGHGQARADEVTITGSATSGTITGIPQLTFVGNPNFTNTTSMGIGALSGSNSLGTFFLSTAPGQLVAGTFTLDITFTSPSRLIAVEFIRFHATIRGSVSPNGDQGGVFIDFRDFQGQNFREERGYSNLEAVGFFTMEVPDLFVQTGQSASLTSGTTGQQEPIPEPATLLLLGTGLAGIAAKLRKRRNDR